MVFITKKKIPKCLRFFENYFQFRDSDDSVISDRNSKVKGSPISKAPVQTHMAILARRLILLAILLFEQFIHLTQINVHPNKQLLSTQQHAYQSYLSYFLLIFRLGHCGMLCEF